MSSPQEIWQSLRHHGPKGPALKVAGEIQKFKDWIKRRSEPIWTPLCGFWASSSGRTPSRPCAFGGEAVRRRRVEPADCGSHLRADGKLLSTPQIASAIIEVKGYGHEAKPALVRRVRQFKSPHAHRQMVDKIGDV